MASIRRPSGITYLAIAALLVLAVPGAGQGGRRTPAMATPHGWTGSAGVGVEVRDRDGHPLDGAEVQLAFSEGGEAGRGPAPVRTDASGRASIRGLAPGEWVLTVRDPRTMAYVATLQVREGRRAREINASQVKVGESLVSVRVKYFEASGPAEHPVPAMPRPEAAPAPKTAPVPRAEPAPQPPTAPPAAAPAKPSTAAPAPSAPVPEATPAPAAPAPQPAAEPVPEPTQEAAPTPEPVPEKTPEPTQTAQPTPERAASAQPAAPRRSALRSADTGSCPECRPGEWSVTGEGTAAAGEGICPDDLEARIKRAAALLGSSRALGPWAGSIELAGGVRSVLADDAACRALAVILPAGAAFSGFEMAAADGAEWTQCLPGKDCLGGGWVGDPMLVRTPAGLVVAGAYRNAGTAPRRVRLTVYFTAPEGWAPR